jgi:hypothetical protein
LTVSSNILTQSTPSYSVSVTPNLMLSSNVHLYISLRFSGQILVGTKETHLFFLASYSWLRHRFGQVDIPMLLREGRFGLVLLQLWTSEVVGLLLMLQLYGPTCCTVIRFFWKYLSLLAPTVPNMPVRRQEEESLSGKN